MKMFSKILHIGGRIAVVLHWREGEVPASFTFHRWNEDRQEWIQEDLSEPERSALEKVAHIWLRANRENP